MKATNALTSQGQGKEKQTFSVAVTGEGLQNLIKKSVATPEAAARFTGTLISAVAASPQLQACKPATVVAAALRGEGMGLSLGREYHLIPFGESCAYVIGYKGLIALCLAGNDVADMDCIEVREGEYIGRDKRTKRPKFDFSVYETDDEAAMHPVIGYYAYVEFVSGRFRFEYMTVNEILDHAARYSKAFDIDKWRKLQNGELSPQEAEKLKSGSPYYSAPETMFKKTVIRKLLNSGYVRLANSAAVRDAISYDTSIENGIVASDFGSTTPTVDEDTGEVIDATVNEDTEEKTAETPEHPEAQVITNAGAKRGRPPKKQTTYVDAEYDDSADDAVESFFDEVGAKK